ncbi:MAG: tyrosine-protein phosphatase [Anaerolineae bacterium]|nr:tyrosine-protein phosphatase [Anaerolineae bacterium]
MNQRRLSWEGCVNVRDLGGLRTGDGRMTHYGALVRSDSPSRLTAAGWAALYAYGIRTIITLNTHGMVEEALVVSPPYPDLVTVQVAIEDVTDREFARRWASSDLWGTPLYYRDALGRWPQRHAAAISAIARACPGGVLFHCIRGHDRTGIIALLLLALIGVVPEDIVADYELSVDPIREELLAHENSSVPEALFGALEGLDVADYLKSGGAIQEDLDAIRRRLLG